MKFELRILMGNEAMRDGAAIAGALRSIANTIEDRTTDGLRGCASKIWDANGNVVGNWKILKEDK